MNAEIDLRKLKGRLPRGYAAILQTRLQKKFNKEYHLQSIRRGLTNRAPNEIMIQEAILLAEETERKTKDLVRQVKNL